MKFNQMFAWIAGLAVLSLVGSVAVTSLAEDKKDENEVKLPFDKAPQAVQDGLKKAARDAKITEVEKETENGKTVYSADVTIDGKKHEIKVAEDGSLISNKIDEDDDKDEKTERDGKKEHKD